MQDVDLVERELNILICEEEDKFRFEIGNLRPVISQDIIDKIFLRGFSTKGDKGIGLGLYNVENIVKKYCGEIMVSIDHNSGTLKVLFPKV